MHVGRRHRHHHQRHRHRRRRREFVCASRMKASKQRHLDKIAIDSREIHCSATE